MSAAPQNAQPQDQHLELISESTLPHPSHVLDSSFSMLRKRDNAPSSLLVTSLCTPKQLLPTWNRKCRSLVRSDWAKAMFEPYESRRLSRQFHIYRK